MSSGKRRDFYVGRQARLVGKTLLPIPTYEGHTMRLTRALEGGRLMKIVGKVETEAVTDVICDVCRLTSRSASGGLQFATLQAHWGYGATHDGERYEIHLCEGCFFQTVANLKQQRRTQNLFCGDGGLVLDDFGVVAKDDFFGDTD